MAMSQNVRFSGPAPPGADNEHPAGASIAKFLRSSLLARGWQVSEPENWRDVGWSIVCRNETSKLEIVLARFGREPSWILQIAPAGLPGIIAKLIGKKPSATPLLTFALAKDVHQVLSLEVKCFDFKWRWDGFPEEESSTLEPTPPAG